MHRVSLLIGCLFVGGCGGRGLMHDAGGGDGLTPSDVGDDTHALPDTGAGNDEAGGGADVGEDGSSSEDAGDNDAAGSGDATAEGDGVWDGSGGNDVPEDGSVGEDSAPPDTPADAFAEVGEAGRSKHARLYVAIGHGFQGNSFIATDLVLIDVTEGRALQDVSLSGTRAIHSVNGSLLVARGHGYTRISVLDPDTLEVERTQLLPLDPGPSVFSADGQYLYAAHGEGKVAQVRVADGVVTADVQVSGPAGVDGLALNASETHLGATSINSGSGSTVAVVRIAGQTLTVTNTWLSQPFSGSNCDRFAGSPTFSRTGSKLVTFDNNCGAFDIYDLSTGAFDPMGSVLFARPDGLSGFSNAVVDSLGQFWSANGWTLYRTSPADPTRAASWPFGPDPGPLVTDASGETIYAFQHDPRTNGVFTIDKATGAPTRLAWNLDLVPLYAVVVTASYAEH